MLEEHPRSANAVKYELISTAKGADNGAWYGSVLWGFEIFIDGRKAKLRNENLKISWTEGRDTSQAAVKAFDEYYRNPGRSLRAEDPVSGGTMAEMIRAIAAFRERSADLRTAPSSPKRVSSTNRARYSLPKLHPLSRSISSKHISFVLIFSSSSRRRGLGDCMRSSLQNSYQSLFSLYGEAHYSNMMARPATSRK